MQMPTYKVYIKVDINDSIIEVNSSAFLTDLNEYILINDGISESYHHAQGNYFSKSIITEHGVYRYKWINNQIYEKTDEEIANEESIIQSNLFKQNQIKELKQNLFDTDYVVIKIAEGAATIDEYSNVIAQRQVWREEINQLESE